MIFLASALQPPDPTHLAIWIGCAYAVLKVYNEAQVARGKHKFPNPLVTRGEVRYATHEELEQLRGEFLRFRESLEREFSELEHKIDENYRQSIKAGEARATKIHDRINLISEQMPSRIIELLKNTGALKQ